MTELVFKGKEFVFNHHLTATFRPPYKIGNDGWSFNDNVNSPMINERLGEPKIRRANATVSDPTSKVEEVARQIGLQPSTPYRPSPDSRTALLKVTVA